MHAESIQNLMYIAVDVVMILFHLLSSWMDYIYIVDAQGIETCSNVSIEASLTYQSIATVRACYLYNI